MQAISILQKRFAVAGLRRWLELAARLVLGAARTVAEELRAHLRLDLPLILIAAAYLVAFLPIVPRATDNPQLLTCCINDEAPLSMALDGMRAFPYGDPFNFVLAPVKGTPLPDYWSRFNYAGVGYYYGGFYMGLAFLAYSPLQALGLPPFPTAPIILRLVSTLSGLIALMVAYNFARRHAGRIAAVVTAIVLATDQYFIHYAIIIHPDGTQFALALLTLALAARHARTGDVESLAGLGLLSGLVQGTKMGGPWLIPMVGLAALVGIRQCAAAPSRRAWLTGLARRGALLLVLSLAAYFVSTPYAFLSRDFLDMSRTILGLVGSGALTPISAWTWLSDLWRHFGPGLTLAAAAGALVVCVQAAQGRPRWPMLLALVLGLTQLAWYSLNAKLWVELGYMLGTFFAIGLFAGELLRLVARALGRFGAAGRAGAAAVVALAIVSVLSGRWWAPMELALGYRLIDSRTVVRIGRWAEAGHLPRDARILWDDTAYFDPAKFPNARMLGGLLTYNELHAWRPDYIILSSSMYGARHFAELIATQAYTMQNEGPNSVRLYQDLLDAETPGPTRVPGIEYVRGFSAADMQSECMDAARSAAGGPRSQLDAGSRIGGSGAGDWLPSRVAQLVEQLNHAGRLIEAIAGRSCISTGPTLRLYRIVPPGTPNGFSQPFASSSRNRTKPLAAFDGGPAYWMPTADDLASGASIGFDFGAGGDKAVGRVELEWLSPALAPARAEVQYADHEGPWRTAAAFDIAAGEAGKPFKTGHDLPDGLGAHRLWRVVLRDPPASEAVAVREVRFSDRRS